MGGVCSGGTIKSCKSTEVEHDKSSGFSGKLKSIGSFGKLKNDNSTTYPDNTDAFTKEPGNLYDSGELNFSISQELKPSTPARKLANKVSNNVQDVFMLLCICTLFSLSLSREVVY